MSLNPSGLCMCGCGEKAPLAARTYSKRGIFKGQPMQYIGNHHGRTHRHTRSTTYRSWEAMKRRILSPAAPDWERYGGRGISMDPRWHDFTAFLADMGERPKGLTLDRINNEGDYTPENCRWATAAQQIRNRRSVRLDMEKVRDVRLRYAAGGVTQRQLAAELGLHSAHICKIVNHQIWREDA